MTIAVDQVRAERANSLYPLTPGQHRTYEKAIATVAGSSITVLKGVVGSGKSLIVSHLQRRLGGTIYSLDQIIADVVRSGSNNIEEILIEFLDRALRDDNLVFIEDVTMLDLFGQDFIVDRPRYLNHVLSAFYDRLHSSDARLVVATADRLNRTNERKAALVEMEPFATDDYVAVVENRVDSMAPSFDGDRVSRAYKKLTAREIVTVVELLKHTGVPAPDAGQFIEAMDEIKARSNLAVDDVEDVTLDGLIGIDEIVREVQRTVIIPMTQPDLARELGLKPARGILLHGEPGTGKTTIGRALARQLKGKFFIMDGSTQPGPAQDMLLAAAEASSPSVFFIDDADVLFKNGDNGGFARKLLTKLDGIQSESIGNVCIIMTAMDVADMPPAVVRSGRVEVWLHMKQPDERKRADIIAHYARSLPEDLRHFDERELIAATEGFTPADLRALVGDARGHIAYDRNKGRPAKSFQDYLLLAVEEIQERKRVLAELAGKKVARPKKIVKLQPPVCTDGVCG